MKNANKNNRGFSMVELIIVIAIMAILAAALAPALIKYLNKARLSSDIDLGKAIASAIMNNLADDGDKMDNATTYATPHEVNQMQNATFKADVFLSLQSATGGNIYGKSKKDATGAPFPSNEFFYTLDTAKNKVEVYYGGKTADYQIYPVIGSKMLAQ